MSPENIRNVTNLAGIVFPTIIVRGKIRARWKSDGDRIQVTPFERLYKKDERAIIRAFKREFGAKMVAFCNNAN